MQITDRSQDRLSVWNWRYESPQSNELNCSNIIRKEEELFIRTSCKSDDTPIEEGGLYHISRWTFDGRTVLPSTEKKCKTLMIKQ